LKREPSLSDVVINEIVYFFFLLLIFLTFSYKEIQKDKKIIVRIKKVLIVANDRKRFKKFSKRKRSQNTQVLYLN